MKADEHWDKLAEETEAWADYQDSRGEYSVVTRRKAKLYRDAATAIRMSDETGILYCTCHLAPLAEQHSPKQRLKYQPKGLP